ncbi:phenylalanine--tRNA ligase subunit beta, partial [candidate division FCPU426 bacterium]|nr:phenylalanine--tRNA ligase subunit beta [candidate division FCPU426 bacterium]
MKVAWSWLENFVDLAGITPQELAHRLTMSGLEVSSLSNKAEGLDKVVVGKIINVSPHPNADKLSLTEVEIPGEVLRIVCGAKNIAPGDIVPVAQVGTILPNGLHIQRAHIRGEDSHGMICSETELGLAKSSDGIMHLSPEAPLGMPAMRFLHLDETVLELEVTPNRADCLSHLGIARHLSAVLNRPLRLPAVSLIENQPCACTLYQVEVEPGCGCRRYCARIIRNIKTGPSPEWLQRRLESLDIRPINNVVDVTNYVLMEIGHPLHAFDLDKLQGCTIKARRALPGESLLTLDGVDRMLSPADLVIADDKRPVALAGVMGGANTEVTAATANILLEAAWFDPQVVRAMSRRSGCASESSHRFERGTDPEIGLTLAIDRAAQLIAELAGGTVMQGIVDVYAEKLARNQIPLRLERVVRVLGMQINPDIAMAALSRLGFHAEPAEQPYSYRVWVPSFRQDVVGEEDLIEEIAELAGYDKIPVTLPLLPLTCPAVEPQQAFHRFCRLTTAALGMQEVLCYSFHGPRHWDWLRLPADHPWRQAMVVKNPLSEDMSQLRTSLLPGLIAAASFNQRHGQERIYLFEIGAVFIPRTDDLLPDEPRRLGMIITGPRHPRHWRLGNQNPPADFYDLKGIAEEFLRQLHVGPPVRFLAHPLPHLHPACSF